MYKTLFSFKEQPSFTAGLVVQQRFAAENKHLNSTKNMNTRTRKLCKGFISCISISKNA